MHNHEANPPTTAYSPNLSQANVACSLPLTPPPEIDDRQHSRDESSSQRSGNEEEGSSCAVNDNTAAGMSMMQEASLYASRNIVGEKMDSDLFNDRNEVEMTPEAIAIDNSGTKNTSLHDCSSSSGSCDNHQNPSTPMSVNDLESCENDKENVSANRSSLRKLVDKMDMFDGEATSSGNMASHYAGELNNTQSTSRFCGSSRSPAIDEEFDHSNNTKPWDFSSKRLSPEYPSSLFNSNSKYKGTQQSDKQIYNVEVTILTVDIEQSTLSGYLQICGLTPDHPTLTTFFTGEIIGGPNQKYSFRTRDPAWGANDKTDITHWARFPAWRSLSSHAKKNINFAYPLDQGEWWQQEHIFMRWKEHFLVPDYKLKSIQGASFEGFYYICLNQIEGRVSGIYFHSRSEKYQQLELKHEGKQGVWAKGVCPSIEFR